MDSTKLQQRNLPTISDSGFQRSPFELLEEIYILSETVLFPLVCRRFNSCLTNELTRLRFCTRLFFLGNPYNLESGAVSCLVQKQANIVLAQEWFTEKFAINVEDAVLHIQEEAITYSEEPSKLTMQEIYTERQCPYTGGLVPRLGPNEFTTSRQVYLPVRLIRDPWAESRWALLRFLEHWGVSLHSVDLHTCYQTMKDAILSNNVKVFDLLLTYRGEIDYELFRLVMSTGCDNDVVMVFRSHILAYVRQHTVAGDLELYDWLKFGGWNALLKHSDPHGSVETGCDNVSEGNCKCSVAGEPAYRWVDIPEGYCNYGVTSEPPRRCEEVDVRLEARLKRVFQAHQLRISLDEKTAAERWKDWLSENHYRGGQ